MCIYIYLYILDIDYFFSESSLLCVLFIGKTWVERAELLFYRNVT